jgi:hypothetical protein
MPKMTNKQKWARVERLRAARSKLGPSGVEELLRLELELSCAKYKPPVTAPTVRWAVEALIAGQRVFIGRCEATEQQIRTAWPYAAIKGNLVTIFASPNLEEL